MKYRILSEWFWWIISIKISMDFYLSKVFVMYPFQFRENS